MNTTHHPPHDPLDRLLADSLAAVRASDSASEPAMRDSVLSALPAMPPVVVQRGAPWWSVPLATAAGFAIAALVWVPGTPPAATNSSTSDASPTNVPAPHPAGALVARLGQATGLVELRQADGSWTPLATGAALEANAEVRTTGRSKAAFAIVNRGVELRLAPDTRIVLPDARSCRVIGGVVNTRIGGALERAYQLITDELNVDTAPGELQVSRRHPRGDADPAAMETVVVSIHGTAIVRHSGGERRLMVAQTVRGTSRAIGQVQQIDSLRRTTDWLLELVAMKGSTDPEFNSRINDMLIDIGDAKSAYLDEEQIRELGESCALPLLSFVQADRSLLMPERRRRAARMAADVCTLAHVDLLLQLLADDDGQVRVHLASGVVRVLGREPAGAIDSPAPPPTAAQIQQAWGSQADGRARHRLLDEWTSWWAANRDQLRR
ncbi:MAG: hypothetical protein AB7K09_23430 [Planctomycetota bacterium]